MRMRHDACDGLAGNFIEPWAIKKPLNRPKKTSPRYELTKHEEPMKKISYAPTQAPLIAIINYMHNLREIMLEMKRYKFSERRRRTLGGKDRKAFRFQ